VKPGRAKPPASGHGQITSSDRSIVFAALGDCRTPAGRSNKEGLVGYHTMHGALAGVAAPQEATAGGSCMPAHSLQCGQLEHGLISWRATGVEERVAQLLFHLPFLFALSSGVYHACRPSVPSVDGVYYILLPCNCSAVFP